MEAENRTYTYTYSAKQREEVERIRKKYLPKEEDKMKQLRRLDQSVTKRGAVVSIIIGIISTLVFGFGMCCSMLWADYFVIGIVAGVFGLAGIAGTYPIYNLMVKRARKQIAPQILALSEELMK